METKLMKLTSTIQKKTYLFTSANGLALIEINIFDDKLDTCV